MISCVHENISQCRQNAPRRRSHSQNYCNINMDKRKRLLQKNIFEEIIVKARSRKDIQCGLQTNTQQHMCIVESKCVTTTCITMCDINVEYKLRSSRAGFWGYLSLARDWGFFASLHLTNWAYRSERGTPSQNHNVHSPVATWGIRSKSTCARKIDNKAQYCVDGDQTPLRQDT